MSPVHTARSLAALLAHFDKETNLCMHDAATARNRNLEKQPSFWGLDCGVNSVWLIQSAPRMTPETAWSSHFTASVFMSGYYVSLKFQTLWLLTFERLLSKGLMSHITGWWKCQLTGISCRIIRCRMWALGMHRSYKTQEDSVKLQFLGSWISRNP